MAIILEEERKKVNWVSIAGGAVVVLALFIGGYYLFFKKPELIDVVVPQALAPINTISKIQQFDPQAVLNSSNFKALKDYTAPLVLPVPGRENPFRP